MTRSSKKHPFGAVTATKSEKADKLQAHRRERHAVRQALHSGPDIEVLPHRKDFGDRREFSKDGKLYLPRWRWGRLTWVRKALGK